MLSHLFLPFFPPSLPPSFPSRRPLGSSTFPEPVLCGWPRVFPRLYRLAVCGTQVSTFRPSLPPSFPSSLSGYDYFQPTKTSLVPLLPPSFPPSLRLNIPASYRVSKHTVALGASGALNAIVAWSIFMFPTRMVYVYMVLVRVLALLPSLSPSLLPLLPPSFILSNDTFSLS